MSIPGTSVLSVMSFCLCSVDVGVHWQDATAGCRIAIYPPFKVLLV